MPTPSWPGMNGGVGLTGQSPCAAWMSVWQRPGRLDPDPDLARLELEAWHVLDDERLVEAVHHRRAVGARLRLEADGFSLGHGH